MKKGYNLVHVIIIIIITSIVSAITTGVIISNTNVSNTGVNYSSLIMDEDIKQFLDAYSELSSKYYKDLNKSSLIQSAINGMMNYLDESYTTYMNEDEANELMDSLNAKYTGIGIVIVDNKVESLVLDSPAQKAGILENDEIVKVNSVDVANLSSAEITEIIKEKPSVNLEIKRNDEILHFSLVSEELKVPNVTYKVLEDTSIGYLQIGLFSSTVAKQTKNALSRLERLGIDSLIVDVRGNSGGYLDQTYDTVSLFLDKGQTMYYIEDKNDKVAYKDETDESVDYPIVVLTNSSTASAAEILTAALKDSYGATVVGDTTYGKGKVQQTHNLSDGGLIKYTSAKWLRPNGTCIDTIGINPDHYVDNEFISEEDENGNIVVIDIIDYQLTKAIELLSK